MHILGPGHTSQSTPRHTTARSARGTLPCAEPESVSRHSSVHPILKSSRRCRSARPRTTAAQSREQSDEGLSCRRAATPLEAPLSRSRGTFLRTDPTSRPTLRAFYPRERTPLRHDRPDRGMPTNIPVPAPHLESVIDLGNQLSRPKTPDIDLWTRSC
ncbi:unnamed protein product [Musa banksii]